METEEAASEIYSPVSLVGKNNSKCYVPLQKEINVCRRERSESHER